MCNHWLCSKNASYHFVLWLQLICFQNILHIIRPILTLLLTPQLPFSKRISTTPLALSTTFDSKYRVMSRSGRGQTCPRCTAWWVSGQQIALWWEFRPLKIMGIRKLITGSRQKNGQLSVDQDAWGRQHKQGLCPRAVVEPCLLWGKFRLRWSDFACSGGT